MTEHGPSPHLSWRELRCHDAMKTPYPHEWSARASELGDVFEQIRAVLGDKPMRVGSAYRTPEHNRAVGGAKMSQHLQGRALDLYPPTGTTVRELHAAAMEVAQRPGSLIHGIGRYATFVHVDTRVSAALITWTAQDSHETSGE